MTTEQLSNKIAAWMADYANGAGIKSFVVGVSGGIDSAVALRLSQCAISRSGSAERVIAVAMPMAMGRDSAQGSLYRAMELCVGKPDVEFHIRPIGHIHDAYLEEGVANHLLPPDKNQLLGGNLRSRIRANILADFAGATNGIVVGTGNKDEDEIGYFTKWGDGAVDICPMSKIHKSQVYEIGRWLSVPESILTVKPTAGLWDGQTDEDELGMTYDEVEWALKHDESPNNEDPEPASRQGIVLEKVRRMRKVNAHKLAYAPVFDPGD